MGYVKTLELVFRTLVFDRKAIVSLAERPLIHGVSSLGFLAITHAVISALFLIVLGFFGIQEYHMSLFMLVTVTVALQLLVLLLGFLLVTSLIHGTARFMGGKNGYRRFFVLSANTTLLFVPLAFLSQLPLLGGLITFFALIYITLVWGIAVAQLYGISEMRALLVVSVPWILGVALLFLLLLVIIVFILFSIGISL